MLLDLTLVVEEGIMVESQPEEEVEVLQEGEVMVLQEEEVAL